MMPTTIAAAIGPMIKAGPVFSLGALLRICAETRLPIPMPELKIVPITSPKSKSRPVARASRTQMMMPTTVMMPCLLRCKS